MRRRRYGTLVTQRRPVDARHVMVRARHRVVEPEAGGLCSTRTGREACHKEEAGMPRIVVVATISLLLLFGVVGCVRGAAPSEADGPEPVPASAEATEQPPPETPDTTAAETPEKTTSEEERASGEADGSPAPQPVGRENEALSRSIEETCAARAGVPVPAPEDLVAEADEGFGADPDYLDCIASEGEAVNGMLDEGRSVGEILEARYGE